MDTAKLGDRRVDRAQVPRVIYARQSKAPAVATAISISSLAVWGLGASASAALGYVLNLGLLDAAEVDQVMKFDLANQLFQVSLIASMVSLGALGVSLIAAFVRFCMWLLPVETQRLWRLDTPRELRRVAIMLARHWSSIASAAWSPVTTPRGDLVFPGLWGIWPGDGDELVVAISLPHQVPSGGRQSYVEAGVRELPIVHGIAMVELKELTPIGHKYNVAVLSVVPTDRSAELREVTV